MIDWFIDIAPVLFSGIGVFALGLAGNWLYQRFGWFKGFFNNIYHFPDDDLTGDWEVTGYDISLGSEDLVYSRELKYIGRLRLTSRGKKVLLRGDITENPPSEQWHFTGRGTFHGNHLMVNYVLEGGYEAPTLGFLFWNVDDARTSAQGFFLARRSLDKETKNKTGIAFGKARLRRLRKGEAQAATISRHAESASPLGV